MKVIPPERSEPERKTDGKAEKSGYVRRSKMGVLSVCNKTDGKTLWGRVLPALSVLDGLGRG